jgi:hypothetical protein
MKIKDNMSTTFDHQAEMWATLTGPPEQFVEIAEWIDIVRPDLLKQFNRTSLVWGNIDTNEVMRKFKIACVEHAVEHAKKAQPTPLPDYWDEVAISCQRSIDILNGIGDMDMKFSIEDFNAANAAAVYCSNYDLRSPVRLQAYSAARAACAAVYAVYAKRNIPGSVVNTILTTIDAATLASGNRIAPETESTKMSRAYLIQLFINIILSEPHCK